jgi:hypothetical protein
VSPHPAAVRACHSSTICSTSELQATVTHPAEIHCRWNTWDSLACSPDSHRRYTWADLDEYVPDHVIEVAVALLNRLPAQLQETVRTLSFTAMPVQIHSVWLALFASVIAPFGESKAMPDCCLPGACKVVGEVQHILSLRIPNPFRARIQIWSGLAVA